MPTTLPSDTIASDAAALTTLAHRWFDAISSGELDIVYELFAPTYRLHYPGLPDGDVGPEVIRALIAGFRTAFPDLHLTVEDTVASGDTVVVRWTAEGTNDGPLMGAAPTGKRARWTGMSYLKVRDGRVIEDWVETDQVGMMQQLV
jgi:predicted ester cyclase